MAPLAVLFTFAALLSRSLAAPANSSGGRTHYAPSKIASHWQHVGPSSSTDEIPVTFVLKGKDYDGLTAKMEQIALEGGEWLSVEDLANYVGPADESKAALEAAVKESFGTSDFEYSATGDKLTVKTTVEAASKVRSIQFLARWLCIDSHFTPRFPSFFYRYCFPPTKFFQTSFSQYAVKGKGTAHRTLQYTIPDALTAHVDDVYPIATFAGKPVSDLKPVSGNFTVDPTAAAAGPDCGTPSCYRDMYQYSSYTPTASYTNIGV